MDEVRKIKADKYGTWIVINLVIPIFILSISYYFPNATISQIFSGFITYFLGLLIVSLSIFYLYSRIEAEQPIFSELRFSLTIFFIIVIITTYFFFNLHDQINKLISNYILAVIVGVTLGSSIFSILLHAPALNRQIQGEIVRKQQKSTVQIIEDLKEIKKELEEEDQ
ncbi:MAG: hypothetical protein V1890_06385 [Candidatus Zixiibacteriota bacterium]